MKSWRFVVVVTVVVAGRGVASEDAYNKFLNNFEAGKSRGLFLVKYKYYETKDYFARNTVFREAWC
jgi:hypothetical protein